MHMRLFRNTLKIASLLYIKIHVEDYGKHLFKTQYHALTRSQISTQYVYITSSFGLQGEEFCF